VTEPAPAFAVRPVQPEDARALSALFERAGVACHCRYWHFAGTTNDWLARIAHAPDENRREMEHALASGSDEMRGLVAFAGGQIVGWLKLTPASAVPKLYDQRLYRGLPCLTGDRAGVLTVGCLLVDPGWRRRGVARALIAATVARARATGARAVEAFPRRADGVSDAELFTGPYAAFLEAGFEVVHDFAPYPVLRATIGA
jgi:GNAT superfamily N-acetyltransferase